MLLNNGRQEEKFERNSKKILKNKQKKRNQTSPLYTDLYREWLEL